MISLTKEENRIHREQKVCYICKKGLRTDDGNIKNYKVRDHCHYTGISRGATHDICNLRYKTLKEISWYSKETFLVFYNGSTYDYHFIIKKLAEEFEGQFKCLGENTEKYVTFQYQLKKD